VPFNERKSRASTLENVSLNKERRKFGAEECDDEMVLHFNGILESAFLTNKV